MLTGPALDRAQARYDATAEPEAPDTRFLEQARHERDTIPSLIADWLYPELIYEDKSLDVSALIAAMQSGQELPPGSAAVVIFNCKDQAIVFQAAQNLCSRYHADTDAGVAARAQELSDEKFQEAEEARAEGVEALLVSP
jgi:hypothetical protein